jgi:hypothetical protein
MTFVYESAVYLTTLSLTQILYRRFIESLMGNELKKGRDHGLI